MGYHEAQRCFDENAALLGNPPSDPILWNLNAGIARAAKAIEDDLADIKDLLRRLLQAQQR